MKGYLVLGLGLVVICLACTPASAAPSASAVASVYVNVNPNISVSTRTTNVDAGAVQTGRFFAMISYTIASNVDTVNFQIEASDLFKGGDPSGVWVTPIALDRSTPAQITAPNGHRVGLLPDEASWQGAGANIGNFPTFKSYAVAYESSQNGRFSQDVTLKIFYNQPNPDKPVGQYIGKVRFIAYITSQGSE